MSIYDFKVRARDGGEISLFLINREGEIAARFEPTVSLKDVKAKVEEVL